MQALKEIPRVRGFHIVASGWADVIPEVLTRCGIGQRTPLEGDSRIDAPIAAH